MPLIMRKLIIMRLEHLIMTPPSYWKPHNEVIMTQFLFTNFALVYADMIENETRLSLRFVMPRLLGREQPVSVLLPLLGNSHHLPLSEGAPSLTPTAALALLILSRLAMTTPCHRGAAALWTWKGPQEGSRRYCRCCSLSRSLRRLSQPPLRPAKSAAASPS